MVRQGSDSSCILCRECIKICPKGVLGFGIRKTVKLRRVAQNAASEHDVI